MTLAVKPILQRVDCKPPPLATSHYLFAAMSPIVARTEYRPELTFARQRAHRWRIG